MGLLQIPRRGSRNCPAMLGPRFAYRARSDETHEGSTRDLDHQWGCPARPSPEATSPSPPS
eukprot:8042361-Pyramimonas_sp.AAC.1